VITAARLARLKWRARRGARELDSLLLTFVEEQWQNLDDVALGALERLLEEQDPVLLDWFLQRQLPADAAIRQLIDQILKYTCRRRQGVAGVGR
jgi:succinate dehydrogenase flavin-adding protein (antitoxin of CptAB toxin-antitoxin module)|tara:strand:- start:1260 stop:1541 length:282 start_codon:yes stop_codon:yes gene_type:complete